MAGNQKKKTNTKSNTQAKKKQPQKGEQVKSFSPEISRQRNSIIIMAVAVFMLFVALIKGESVWNWLHNGLIGLFGFCTYLVAGFLVYLAYLYSKNKPVTDSLGKIIGIAGFITLLSGAVHIFSESKEYFTDTTLIEQIADVWENRPSFVSGGVYGAFFGGALARLFGRTGAIVTVIIVLVAIALILTGTSLSAVYSAVKKPVKKVGQITNETIEKGVQRREERKEKKAFAPPAKPTETAPEASEDVAPLPPDIKFEEQFVNDETTFVPEPEKEPDIVIPVFRLADEKPDVIEETIEMAVEEKKAKKKAKAPAAPDGEPVDEEDIIEEFEIDDVPFEIKQDYVFPPIDCLKLAEKDGATDSVAEMQMGAKKLISTLESFKINAEVTNICRGPSVTRYELVPEAGVRINKITNLSDDIALRLAATSVRIEAPIPGKSAIGIEVPNSAKSMVTMREIIDTPQFRDAKSKLNVALGKDITGNIICADLAKMPHLLVAGTTGSGKSVCLNSMIVSLLYNATPDEVRLLMIDPKMVEFTIYNGIAHLEVPVVSNPRKAAGALGWAVGEMERRYAMFAENGVRDIKGFNVLAESRPELKKIHQIVIFIDELSDLMMVSPKEVEDSICRLAQKARAAGIHLVIATQRPSVDVITGIIKANIPSRIALSVSSQIDSRTILDAAGAEKLLGNGDMLFNPVGTSKSLRVQGCFISDAEVESVVSHIKAQAQTTYNEETIKEIETKAAEAENSKKKQFDDDDEEIDPMFNEAVEVVVNAGGASTTMLQKKLKLGYARASRVMDQLEEKGIVGPSEGAKPRAVLISKQQWYEMQALSDGGAAPDIDGVFEDDDDFAGSDDYDF